MATWTASMHPRAPKGPAGGEFASGSASSKPAARKPAGGTVPKGSLGYNGKTGTGYGKKGGDARVKALQKRLNAMGMKDADGKPLALDGRLGPKTTAAIMAWQKRNGMKPTGMVDAASLRKLGGSGRTTHHVRAGAASRAVKPQVAAGRRATPRSSK